MTANVRLAVKDVDYTKAFNKQFQKLPSKQQKQVRAAAALFLQDVAAPSLRNHGLKGEWQGSAQLRLVVIYAYIFKL